MVAQLRQSIRVTPTTDLSRTFAVSSSQRFIEFIHVLHAVKPEKERNIERITGLPYSELVRQCLVSVGGNLQDMKNSMVQLDTLNIMVSGDPSPVFRDVLASQKILTWSASIMKAVNSRRDEIPDEHGPPGYLNWHARTMLVFKFILRRSERAADARPALEAIKSKVLHLVEWCLADPAGDPTRGEFA